jgi:hypothetical protein
LMARAFHLAHYVFPKGGTCLEFGVFTGGTYCYQAGQIQTKYPQSSLIGFDSWRGLPAETPGVWAPSRHAPGEYSAAKREVLARLESIDARDDDRFRLVDGFFSESLTRDLQSQIKDVIFINIDVDIHRSTLELLDFVGPLLRPGVVIYWDDWKAPTDASPNEWGEHLAWSEWSAKQDRLQVETIEVNPVNQRTMVVTQAGDRRLSPPVPSIADIRLHAFSLSSIEEAPEANADYQRFLHLKSRLRNIPFHGQLARAVRRFMP